MGLKLIMKTQVTRQKLKITIQIQLFTTQRMIRRPSKVRFKNKKHTITKLTVIPLLKTTIRPLKMVNLLTNNCRLSFKKIFSLKKMSLFLKNGLLMSLLIQKRTKLSQKFLLSLVWRNKNTTIFLNIQTGVWPNL